MTASGDDCHRRDMDIAAIFYTLLRSFTGRRAMRHLMEVDEVTASNAEPPAADNGARVEISRLGSLSDIELAALRRSLEAWDDAAAHERRAIAAENKTAAQRATEPRVLEQLALLTEQHGPLLAAQIMFAGRRSGAGKME